MANIEVRDAQTHNLKNIDVDVPKHQLVVFTGVSGSGKSSLVFDTIYTEAQRQLIETFSTYARRRLPQLSRPPIQEVRNISPCIVIDQKRLGTSSRSTVGTATEIYTYLRMLFSRAATPFIGWSHVYSFNHPEGMCPSCQGIGRRLSINIDRLLDRSKSVRDGAILHPNYAIGKWYYREILWSGVVPADVPLYKFSDELMNRLLWANKYPISYEDRGKTHRRTFDGVARKLEQLHIDKDDDQLSAPARRAAKVLFRQATCAACEGVRLGPEGLRPRLATGHRIGDLVDLELTELDGVLANLHTQYTQLAPVVKTMTDKMRSILGHLIDIGVGYLSLNRSVNTLSGGESQRVKMARQLDCDLVDLIYILDEPSVGLHARDIAHLVDMLAKLRDSGNSVLVVEHDTSIMRAADHLIDVGPTAGEGGGNILYSGSIEGLIAADTATSRALRAEPRKARGVRRPWVDAFRVVGACSNNLRNVSVDIPRGVLVCLTGVAGSGKSSLTHEFIDRARAEGETIVVVDQRPVGRSSRSNPATYIKIFDSIRRLFAGANNIGPEVFSFNSSGSCPECGGRGYIEMELSFMDDIQLECTVCLGRRYRDEVLKYTLYGLSIHDVLQLTVAEAAEFFALHMGSSRSLERKVLAGLELLMAVGVGYLRLGQSLSTLSGGEAQRLKLASELTKTGTTYVMDEPTTGLHPSDIDLLLGIVNQLVDRGNSVVLIEHNLDVIAACDWIIDVGPEGGKNGGRIVAQGTPETIAKDQNSITGQYLASVI